MSSLISLFLFGYIIPTVVISQLNGQPPRDGLPRLDPRGKNVCEYAKSFISSTRGVIHDPAQSPNQGQWALFPDPGNRQRRRRSRRRREASSEEQVLPGSSIDEVVSQNPVFRKTQQEFPGSSIDEVVSQNPFFTDMLDTGQTGAWSSQVEGGAASYQVVNAFGSVQNEVITDFFEYKCCPGWKQKGEECTIAICETPCLFGKCSSPNTCTCNKGWTGSTCNEQCEPGDTSGECGGAYVCDKAAHDCQCLPGYTGQKCTIPCPVGTYGPNCEGKCNCGDHLNDHTTCDKYTGECPVLVDAGSHHEIDTTTTNKKGVNKTKTTNGGVMTGVRPGQPSIHGPDGQTTPAPPRRVVHEALSTMKVVFLTGVAIIALMAAIGGLIYRRRRRTRTISRKVDSFFARKRNWGSLVISELNEVNERRRKAREDGVELRNFSESTYDNPPTPPERRHTYLDTIMEDSQGTYIPGPGEYDGLRQPDGQESPTQKMNTAQKYKTVQKYNTKGADVKPLPQEDLDSIYEVHACGASASTMKSSAARMDSIYTNDSVFSVMNRCKMDNSILTPVGNSIDVVVESPESEYDYPYTDMGPQPAANYGSATEPRQNRRKRFGSRDRRMRKGSSDGQMYSALIRPELEAVSYQKSHSDNVSYESKIERIEEPGCEFQRIDSTTDLYSANLNRVMIGNSWYDKPRESINSYPDVPAPDAPYSDFVRDESDSGGRYAAGYLTSIRKMPSVQITPARHAPATPSRFDNQPPARPAPATPSRFYHQPPGADHITPARPAPATPSRFDYQPPEADHYQSYQCNSVIQRNLYRHQFQTVHNKRPDKPTTISVTSARLKRPNCLPIPDTKYHDYVNGKMISKPPLPLCKAPALPAVRGLQGKGGASPSATSYGFPSPGSTPSPTLQGSKDFPSPDDLDSDNYLSLRFSERAAPVRAAPMKPASNI